MYKCRKGKEGSCILLLGIVLAVITIVIEGFTVFCCVLKLNKMSEIISRLKFVRSYTWCSIVYFVVTTITFCARLNTVWGRR